jgi:peptidoglycan hydrolase-like protein with peptidoglycan-binding domain
MHTFVTAFIVGALWLCPLVIEAGTPGTTGQPRLEDKQLLTKDNLKLVQERLKAEGVYAGPVDGEPNTQTAAALRQYQQKQGLPVSGIADEATLKQFQIRLPTSPQGTGN